MARSGANINMYSDDQILRITELRNILERLALDWDFIISKKENVKNRATFFNNTFLKA